METRGTRKRLPEHCFVGTLGFPKSIDRQVNLKATCFLKSPVWSKYERQLLFNEKYCSVTGEKQQKIIKEMKIRTVETSSIYNPSSI